MSRFSILGLPRLLGGMHPGGRPYEHLLPPPAERDPQTYASFQEMWQLMQTMRLRSNRREQYVPDIPLEDRAWPWERREEIAQRMHEHGVQCFLTVEWSATLHEQSYAAATSGQMWKTRHGPETPLLVIRVVPEQGIPNNEFTTITADNIWSPWHVSLFYNTDNHWTYEDLRYIIHTFHGRSMRLYFAERNQLGRNLTYGLLDPTSDPIASNALIRRLHSTGGYGYKQLHISM